MVDGTPRVLVVRGGWPGHQPIETCEHVAGLLSEAGFDVELSGSLASYTQEPTMSGLDLIVQSWTMGEIDADELAGLLGAVRSGTGLCGWHGGLCDAFRAQPAYQFMTGGQWVAHPGGKIDYEVHFVPERASDPIVSGLADFSVHSEQYYLHVDPSNEVLATTTFGPNEEAPWIAGCLMPVVWKRTYGEGRVFYTSLGHDIDDFDVPQLRQLVVRGCLWAARRQAGGAAAVPEGKRA
jgi:type 1 glutamine amidotransferase